MKLHNIWLFLFSFLPIALGLKIEDSPQAHLDAYIKGATCGPVYSNGNDAYISVEAEDLKYEGRLTDIDNVQFPVAIFKYAYIAYYDDFDTLDEFDEFYSDELFSIDQYRRLLAFNITNIINFHLFNSIGLPSIFIGDLFNDYDYNDYEAKMPAINLKIDKSGIYCVYIVPSPDVAFRETMSARVTFVNSYGYLRYQDYVQYRSFIMSSIIGTTIFIVMYYYYKFKSSKQCPETGDFTNIYRVILFCCLVPLVMVNSLRIIPYFFANNIFPDEELESFYRLLTGSIQFLRHLIMIFIFNYLPVLFSLGYGVFYNSSDTINGQKIGWKRSTSIILFFDLLITISSPASVIFKIIPSSMIMWIVISSFRSIIFRILWLSIYILGYRQTMKNVKNASNFEDSEVKNNIIESFQTSFWVIGFSRMIIRKIPSLLLLIQCHIQFDSNDYKKKLSILGHRNAEEVYDTLQEEFSIFTEFPKSHWPYDLEYYIILIIVFFVWFRTSKAISKKSTPKQSNKELNTKFKTS